MGRKAISPTVLLKIVLLAYSKGIYSSRRIEILCSENILFKSISANTCPDHSTMAKFISSMSQEIQSVFIDVLMVCNQLQLIGGEIFALDGHKVSSNASKEWSGKHSDLEKKKVKLESMVKLLIEKNKEIDKREVKENYEERIGKYKSRIEKIRKFLATAVPRKGKRCIRSEWG